MTGDTAAANLAVLVMAVVVLCMAAFAPMLLLKFAPVAPTGMARREPARRWRGRRRRGGHVARQTRDVPCPIRQQQTRARRSATGKAGSGRLRDRCRRCRSGDVDGGSRTRRGRPGDVRRRCRVGGPAVEPAAPPARRRPVTAGGGHREGHTTPAPASSTAPGHPPGVPRGGATGGAGGSSPTFGSRPTGRGPRHGHPRTGAGRNRPAGAQWPGHR